MMAADLGADVACVLRPPAEGASTYAGKVQMRNKRVVVADLKHPEDVERVRSLIDRADILIEGFRPGVTERLGLGPDQLLARNPRLIYGRITGWGRTGPLRDRAGHDLNYIAMTGLLHAMGRRATPPPPPLNLIGDFGGGSMSLLVGVLAALAERAVSGRGQVVDAAMVTGALNLGHGLWELKALGAWTTERQANLLDGAAPFYDTYVCADGRWVAVGAVEPQFWSRLLEELGLVEEELPDRGDRSTWPQLHDCLAACFATRPRDDWAELFAGIDACVSPVLDLDEATQHPQVQALGGFEAVRGVVQPTPPLAFSRSKRRSLLPPERADLDSLWR
jgi:alpha-methylacyl-CoA racemase